MVEVPTLTLFEMDSEDRYPTPKRRRTSSHSSTSSRTSFRDRETRLPVRHAEPGQIREGTEWRRRYSTSSSRESSRDAERRHDTTGERSSYRRSRSLSRRRRSRTPSSAFSPAPGRSRSRARGRSHSYLDSSDGSRSASPISQAQQRPKSLKFKPLFTIPRAHGRGITSIKFSPDLTLLATSSADATINIYSVPATPTPDAPFKLLRTLRAHLAGVNAIAWSPVGPPYILASASDDKSILLWSPLSSDFPISPSPLMGHSNYVYSVAFSPKGNMLVSGSFDEAVFLWDVRSGRVMRNLPAHSDPVGGVDFLRDGSMVCSCANDGLIRIWDSGTGQCLKTLVDEGRRPVTAVRFTPNGKFVLAWTLDNCIRLWRYIEGVCVKTYLGHVNKEFSLSGAVGSYLHGQEAFVVSGSEDGDLVAWDVTTKEILWRGQGHADVVLSVDFGRIKHSAGLLVSGGKDRDIRVWIEDVPDVGLEEGEEASASASENREETREDKEGLLMDVDAPMASGTRQRGEHAV